MANKTVKIIDISKWQDDNSTPQKMDFAKARSAGAQGVFIKISERGGLDEDYLYNWKSAKAAGISRGGYHFLRWDLSGLLQARIFCSILKDDPGELPPVADFEAPYKDGKYPSNSLLLQFLEEVESILGVRPMIYTSPGFWNSYGRDKVTKLFDDKWLYYDLWVAHYTNADAPSIPEPWKSKGTWRFWQWTASGDGISHGVESKALDLNWFNGDILDYQKFIGEDVQEPEEPAETESPVLGKNDIASLKANINNAIDAWAQDYF